MLTFLWIAFSVLLSAIVVRIFHSANRDVGNASRKLFVKFRTSAKPIARLLQPNEASTDPQSMPQTKTLHLSPSVLHDVQEAEVPGSGQVFQTLLDHCMPIPVDPRKMTFLGTPTDFFEALKSFIQGAKRSIVISALYVGAGKLSQEFVNCLIDKLASSKEVSLVLVLDRNRMEHSTNLVTVSELVKRFPDRVELCLFQESSYISQFVPHSRAREILGTQHTKIFAFDESKIILTGANLSDDYFTTRIDRYLLLESRAVATWYAELGRTLASLSHPVRTQAPAKQQPQSVSAAGPSVFHRKSGLYIHPNSTGADPSRNRIRFRQIAHERMEEFVRRVVTLSHMPATTNGEAAASNHDDEGVIANDTFIFPTLQFGKADILHDSFMVDKVLRSTNQGRIWLSSPYMNIYHTFVDAMLRSAAHFHLITSSTSTNGWKGQKGFAGYIPYYYLQLERSFYYLMDSFGVGDRVWIHEYVQPGRTFHSKGLWISPRLQRADGSSTNSTVSPCKNKHRDPLHEELLKRATPPRTPVDARGNAALPPPEVDFPFLTAIGSTNYGYRSVDKDVESEVFLVTTNPGLRAKMQSELANLFEHGVVVDDRRFKGCDGRFQPVVSIIAQLGQGYM